MSHTPFPSQVVVKLLNPQASRQELMPSLIKLASDPALRLGLAERLSSRFEHLDPQFILQLVRSLEWSNEEEEVLSRDQDSSVSGASE